MLGRWQSHRSSLDEPRVATRYLGDHLIKLRSHRQRIIIKEPKNARVTRGFHPPVRLSDPCIPRAQTVRYLALERTLNAGSSYEIKKNRDRLTIKSLWHLLATHTEQHITNIYNTILKPPWPYCIEPCTSITKAFVLNILDGFDPFRSTVKHYADRTRWSSQLREPNLSFRAEVYQRKTYSNSKSRLLHPCRRFPDFYSIIKNNGVKNSDTWIGEANGQPA